MYACYIGHDAVVNLLLDAKVSVNTNNNRGHSPLMLAASCGNESVANSLVQVSEFIFALLLICRSVNKQTCRFELFW